MPVGKNKRLFRHRRRGLRKWLDPFSRKEWYEIKAPAAFPSRRVGHTCANRSVGLRLSRDSLMGRVLEVNLEDLHPTGGENSHRKIKLIVEEVTGRNCLTNFHGLDLTTDKLRAIVHKRCTLIEAHADVKTTDAYLLRVFVIGFTKWRINQVRPTSYAQTAQVRRIRKIMVDIINREVRCCDLLEFVFRKLVPDLIGREINKKAEGVYPLANVCVRKVKILRSPNVDVMRVFEAHGGVTAVRDLGREVDRPP